MDRYFQRQRTKIFVVFSFIWIAAFGWLCMELLLQGFTIMPPYRTYRHIVYGNNYCSPNSERMHRSISNISRRLMVFDKQNEKLFTYGHLLKKEHSFDRGNIETFREEMFQELGKNITKLLYLTKDNSPLGKQLRYCATSNRIFNVSSEVYEKLPQNSINDRINRCSVVGNSGALLNSSWGKDIDNADFVYRCNAAPLKPFAIDAGTKSNITSFNPSIFAKRYHSLSNDTYYRQFLQDMKQYRGQLWGACLAFDMFKTVCKKALSGYNLTENTFVLEHPDHFKSIEKFWKKRGSEGRLSTGFYFVGDALTRCNEIHLYGFWPFPLDFEDGSIRNLSYHYYDDIKHFGQKSFHVMDIEFSFLAQLHSFGVLKLHHGKCQSSETRG